MAFSFYINPSRRPQSGQGRSKRQGRDTSRIGAEWGAFQKQTPTADPQIGAEAAGIDG
jgi:hypothetical protein